MCWFFMGQEKSRNQQPTLLSADLHRQQEPHIHAPQVSLFLSSPTPAHHDVVFQLPTKAAAARDHLLYVRGFCGGQRRLDAMGTIALVFVGFGWICSPTFQQSR
jgi:hypothetical protein